MYFSFDISVAQCYCEVEVSLRFFSMKQYVFTVGRWAVFPYFYPAILEKCVFCLFPAELIHH
jgi:hypothetical protein